MNTAAPIPTWHKIVGIILLYSMLTVLCWSLVIVIVGPETVVQFVERTLEAVR